MKNEYYEIYEMLYADYIYESSYRRRKPPDEYYLLKLIRKSIDYADKEGLLRPDAKYFLMVNFHHLIIRPLFEQGLFKNLRIDDRIKGFEEDIKENIESDIFTIISETKRDSDRSEISGHQIMHTIDRTWKDLKMTRFELWG